MSVVRSMAPQSSDINLTIDRATLVLDFAKVLYTNGQATEQTMKASERLSNALGLRGQIIARWDGLQLLVADAGHPLSIQAAAPPVGVEMDRVSAAMGTIDSMVSGRLTPQRGRQALAEISRSPPSPTWQFALAAGAGAVALGVIFGVKYPSAAALIFFSAGSGAILRRALGQISANLFLPPFCAAVLSGIIGALAVHYELSSSLRLVAVCPCMVLVPGPHFLNGALDLVGGQISLGAARLVYAGSIVLAISVGLLLGLALLGISLPADPSGRQVALWEDVLAAGVAVAAYSVFFSAPRRMLPWPVGVGMLAHALRWVALSQLHLGPVTGALIACIAVSLILTPVSRQTHMPFAAIGFASVVSMIPGVYLFRMASGLLQVAVDPQSSSGLLTAAVADGMTAVMIAIAMSAGLISIKLVIDYVCDRRHRIGNC
jgi:uncharacterized membrane protein YjjP (DUF1212 family)